jgi:hypothetical protein
MGRALRCHRLFAYNIPCRRPIVGPPQPLSRLDDIRRRRKSLQHCPQVHVHPDCSDAKFMLVAISGDATCLVQSYLATEAVAAVTAVAAPPCWSTLSCGPELHEAV